MSSPGPWPKRAVIWLLFFWLLPLAWALQKLVFLAYFRALNASNPREKYPASVPVLPMK